MTLSDRPIIQQPTTRWRTKPWPWPGDSREDKAKRVARSYRGLAQRISQNRCEDPAGDLHRLDQHWDELGVHWHMPTPDLITDAAAHDEWWSARDLAHAIDKDRRTIYDWARERRDGLGNVIPAHVRQRTGPGGAPQYSVADVIAYNNHLRRKRGKAGRSRNA